MVTVVSISIEYGQCGTKLGTYFPLTCRCVALCRPSTIDYAVRSGDANYQPTNPARQSSGFMNVFVCARVGLTATVRGPFPRRRLLLVRKSPRTCFSPRITYEYCPDFVFTFSLQYMNCPAVSIVPIVDSPGIVIIPSDEMFRTFVSPRIALFSGITLGPNVL